MFQLLKFDTIYYAISVSSFKSYVDIAQDSKNKIKKMCKKENTFETKVVYDVSTKDWKEENKPSSEAKKSN